MVNQGTHGWRFSYYKPAHQSISIADDITAFKLPDSALKYNWQHILKDQLLRSRNSTESENRFVYLLSSIVILKGKNWL